MRSWIAAAARAVAAAQLVAAKGQLPHGLCAQGRQLDILAFHSEILVRRDGSLHVKETITIRFQGEWNGIYRTVPVQYRASANLNYRLRLRVTGVHDAAGNELRTEEQRKGGNLEIRAWVPGARDATHTVVFEYQVANALRAFPDHDELYWNVTGDQWSFPIRDASADVYLPPAATGVRTTAFTGAYGSTRQDVTEETVANVARFHTRTELGLHEGLTVVVGWNPGVVARPSAFDRVRDFLLGNVLLLVPLVALWGMILLWRRYGRDPELGAIAPRYEPPTGMTPAEAGTLIDLSCDMRDITATLVDLAVRGFLRIEESEHEHLFGLVNSRDYTFVRLTGVDESDLKEHERDLLAAIFEDGPTTTLSSMHNHFNRTLTEVTDSQKASLVPDGYYPRNPTTVRTLFVIAGIVVGVGVHLLGMALAAQRGSSPVTAALAGVLTGLVVAIVGWFMPARTVRGTNALREVLGFQEFLNRVEAERFERMVDRPELFERYLPFAMAFGVEKRWAKAFEGICQTPPDWYRGYRGGHFQTALFVADMGRLSSAAGSPMQSAPRSSSGSYGLGGGGFSGGGFGGGGGGGF
ncbi:MAG: DUF2207 domain-containing protein [Gemmatimonadetes bacterium]|nr:DUF2207 domain-containing protein [Gemmatimonadota bacterium]